MVKEKNETTAACDQWLSTRSKVKISKKQPKPGKRRSISTLKSRNSNSSPFPLTQNSPPPPQLKTATKQSIVTSFFQPITKDTAGDTTEEDDHDGILSEDEEVELCLSDTIKHCDTDSNDRVTEGSVDVNGPAGVISLVNEDVTHSGRCSKPSPTQEPGLFEFKDDESNERFKDSQSETNMIPNDYFDVERENEKQTFTQRKQDNHLSLNSEGTVTGKVGHLELNRPRKRKRFYSDDDEEEDVSAPQSNSLLYNEYSQQTSARTDNRLKEKHDVNIEPVSTLSSDAELILSTRTSKPVRHGTGKENKFDRVDFIDRKRRKVRIDKMDTQDLLGDIDLGSRRKSSDDRMTSTDSQFTLQDSDEGSLYFDSQETELNLGSDGEGIKTLRFEKDKDISKRSGQTDVCTNLEGSLDLDGDFIEEKTESTSDTEFQFRSPIKINSPTSQELKASNELHYDTEMLLESQLMF